MDNSLDLDQAIITADNLVKNLQSSLDKLIAKDPLDSTAHNKKYNLGVFKELIKACKDQNSRHAKRAVQVVTFVEGIRHNVLDEDKLPEDTLGSQREEFDNIFKPIVEDYDQIVEDYFR